MDLSALAADYDQRSDDDLTAVVVSDYDLTEAIVAAHPEMAQDAGFELFDRQWARRYWKTLVRDITGLRAGAEIRDWAVGATVSSVADAIVNAFGLPPVVFPAAVALALILTRAARSADRESPADDPDSPDAADADPDPAARD